MLALYLDSEGKLYFYYKTPYEFIQQSTLPLRRKYVIELGQGPIFFTLNLLYVNNDKVQYYWGDEPDSDYSMAKATYAHNAFSLVEDPTLNPIYLDQYLYNEGYNPFVDLSE